MLHHVLDKLPVKDLVTCRLVNRLWCQCATLHLKTRTKTIKLVPDYRNKELLDFASAVSTSDPHRPLPYARFHLDFCNKSAESSRALGKVLMKISSEKCHKLKVFHTVRPEGSVHTKHCAMQRNGCMSFVHLENLEYVIRFYENFEPEHVNMSEVLQRSEGLKILNVFLSSYLGRENQRPILSRIFTAITNPNNNFRRLTTLGIEYSFLMEEHVKILTDWNQPLKSLALGTFDLKPDRKYPFPGEALQTFLKGRSDTLKHLRLKVDKEFPWEELTERLDNGFAYDDDLPLAPIATCIAQKFTFPVMKNLESLEIMGGNLIECTWAWRLNENTFPQHFPKLKKFRLIQFQYSAPKPTAISPDFLPNLKAPSTTVEEVCLPDARVDCDYVLMHHMLSLFPCVRVFEMKYEREAVQTVFSSLPTVEKFILHLGEELVPLDCVLTGVPDLPSGLSHQEALEYDVEANRRAPNITMLKSKSSSVLQSLVLSFVPVITFADF